MEEVYEPSPLTELQEIVKKTNSVSTPEHEMRADVLGGQPQDVRPGIRGGDQRQRKRDEKLFPDAGIHAASLAAPGNLANRESYRWGEAAPSLTLCP